MRPSKPPSTLRVAPASSAALPNLPLPAGMRDILPPEAARRRKLAKRLLDHFALYGYELVTPPAFELADVLERGLGTLDPRDVLRFVEPELGEVAALRPDVTPQIARIGATRLADRPLPMRLCYEGT
ncbi:MAG: ATP phosphoribosyltransferase regulatory subunit, partial [Polyangiaceae bacterium]